METSNLLIKFARNGPVYRSQGEWFFLPVPDIHVSEHLVLRDEPIRQGNGKPHWVEFCYRTSEEKVYVCPRHPNGVSASVYQRTLTANPRAKAWGWKLLMRNACVYVRGSVRHADHKTIVLDGWHRALTDTEAQSETMRNVHLLA
jgi:hypothetical protein